MKSYKLLFSLLLLFFFACSVFSQQPTSTPPVDDKSDTIKISTTLIQADVTVTDKDGNVVRDLKPEDFEIYENGKKQTITNFSFVSVEKTVPNTNPQPVVKADKKAVPIPPVRLKSEQVRRTYALVVDDLGLNFGNVFWVKQSLKKFVNEQAQEGDLVAIIRTGSGIGALQSFTSDKRQLLSTIERIRWNPQGRGGTETFEKIDTDMRQAEIDANRKFSEVRNENFSVGTLGALNYIIRGMGELPGRKAVLLFSEGFYLASDNRVFDSVRLVADLANRSSVVIYTIDPRGLQNPDMFYAQDNVVKGGVFPGSRAANLLEQRGNDFRSTQMSLTYLAYQTGGIPFINQNNIDKGIKQAINDQGSYYLLGYQPDEETFDPKKNKFNRLEVKVKRSGLKVRYRSGFFGVTDEKLNSVPQTPHQRMIEALTSPFGATDVNLSLYPIFQNDATTGDVIQALVYIDAKDLQFTKTPEGKEKAVFDIMAATFGDNGATVDKLSKVFTLEISEKAYQNALQNGFVYALSVPIKKTGAYQFRIALRDTATDKIGSVSQFIEVPNIKKGIVLSNLVLDNFTTDEWQKIRAGGSRDESERSVLLDTTQRQYRRGTILRYDYVIYNSDQSQQIESQMRLIRDGKVVYEEPAAAVKIAGQTDLQRLQTGAAISLGKNLEPGNYILQIIVGDKTKSKKFATQYVELEIVD